MGFYLDVEESASGKAAYVEDGNAASKIQKHEKGKKGKKKGGGPEHVADNSTVNAAATETKMAVAQEVVVTAKTPTEHKQKKTQKPGGEQGHAKKSKPQAQETGGEDDNAASKIQKHEKAKKGEKKGGEPEPVADNSIVNAAPTETKTAVGREVVVTAKTPTEHKQKKTQKPGGEHGHAKKSKPEDAEDDNAASKIQKHEKAKKGKKEGGGPEHVADNSTVDAAATETKTAVGQEVAVTAKTPTEHKQKKTQKPGGEQGHANTSKPEAQ